MHSYLHQRMQRQAQKFKFKSRFLFLMLDFDEIKGGGPMLQNLRVC